jgi:hypothetical protein
MPDEISVHTLARIGRLWQPVFALIQLVGLHQTGPGLIDSFHGTPVIVDPSTSRKYVAIAEAIAHSSRTHKSVLVP